MKLSSKALFTKKQFPVWTLPVIIILIGVAAYKAMSIGESQRFTKDDNMPGYVAYPDINASPTPSPTVTPHIYIGGKFEVIALKNGINTLDLNNDGIMDMVLKTRRENGTSPHWYSMYNIAILSKGLTFDEESQPYWHTVTTENYRDGDILETLSTYEGADGFLRETYLIKAPNQKPVLVMAVRDFGESYADKEKVSFHFYDLEQNTEADWVSDYFYRYRDTAVADRKYVDVREAIAQELAKRY